MLTCSSKLNRVKVCLNSELDGLGFLPHNGYLILNYHDGGTLSEWRNFKFERLSSF
jgi:hypothetical protein